jgi:hypothetical protein
MKYRLKRRIYQIQQSNNQPYYLGKGKKMSEPNYAKRIYYLIAGTIVAVIVVIAFSLVLDFMVDCDTRTEKANHRIEKAHNSEFVPFVP